MRDLLLMSIVFPAAMAALRFPWIGVLLWTWLSLMNPHRYVWGFAATAPLAALAAGCTLLGLMFTQQRRNPFLGAPPVILALMMVWITLSWQLGYDPDGDYAQWDKVMKINFMVLVTMALLTTKLHIMAFVWVCTLSIALLGMKGGVFTILNGGVYRVWGPPGSFIADNNHFATALIMTIPLLRFLQMQIRDRWGRHLLTVSMVLVAAASLGSHSRGGLLALAAMTLMLWWRGRNRVVGFFVIGLVGVNLLTFMPAEWTDRMHTIQTYQEDQSATGRLVAWRTAFEAAKHYPFGIGMSAARTEIFERYSTDPSVGTPVAHSIYFQMLGQHGFIGLFLFLLLWFTTWRWAGALRKESRGVPEAAWCADLGSMCQVALLGYFVGGAFLNLAHYDMPYNLMAILVITRIWVRQRAWEHEPTYAPKRWWLQVPGVRQPAPAVSPR